MSGPALHDGSPSLLRHAFLWRFASAEDRRAVERVMALLHRHLLETCQAGPKPRRPETLAELKAAAADLAECTRDLLLVAEDHDRGRLVGPSARLAAHAAAWAQATDAVARRIEEALAVEERS